MSVDEVEESKGLVERLSLTFPILSDPQSELVKAFGIYDPGNEISWPAIYVLSKDGTITWTKYLEEYKTRPPVSEVLDAVDAAQK